MERLQASQSSLVAAASCGWNEEGAVSASRWHEGVGMNATVSVDGSPGTDARAIEATTETTTVPASTVAAVTEPR